MMHGGPRPPRERRPRGKLTESPRYTAEDVNGKLLALLRVMGHMGRGGGGQDRILTLLKESGETTQRALTEQLGIQPGSASEIIGKLEKAGFLVRTPDPEDRRTTDISLTAAGEIRAAEAAERAAKNKQELLSALSGEEKQTLLALLEKLYGSWEDRRPEV